MANNNLPPQAYTREDVAKAYVWVQSQPDYVKNMATSKEALVALYLQARRNGVSSLVDSRMENIAPVSSRDFKNQLQSLATELNQFEKQKETLKAQVPLKPASPPQTFQNIPETPNFAQDFQEPQEYQMPEPTPSQQFEERSIEFKVSERRPTSLPLDGKSQAIIDRVKQELNLESDSEVVRMLITLGYDKLKNIFPQR